MAALFSIRRRLRFRDTDCAGIAHFTSFYGYMEEAEHEMLRSVGLHLFTEIADGTISWPRVSTHCDFLAPLRFDEEFCVEVSVDAMTEKSVRYAFRFTRDDQVIAEGYTVAACCRVTDDRRPHAIPIPDDMRARLERMKA